MANISVSVEDAAFKQALKKVAELTGRNIEGVVHEQAKLLAQRLTSLTVPKSKAEGSKRVAIDTGKVYLSNEWFTEKFTFKNTTLGERVKNLVLAKNAGDLEPIFRNSPRLNKIHIEPFDANRAEIARGRDGRVKYANPYSFPMSQQSQVKKLISRKKKAVGLAKAGWAACYALLGGNPASWLNRSSAGAVEKGGSNGGYFVTLVNKIPYFARLNEKGRFVSRAMEGRAASMVSAAKRAIARAIADSGLT